MTNRRAALHVCYLCGQPIPTGQSSGDHAVPRVLHRGKQPKVPGFDYGGKLPTHAKCNNGFRDERYVLKALDLIAAFHDRDAILHHSLPGNPPIRVAVLNSEKLPQFTQADLRFFKINDARDDETGAQHIRRAVPGDPLRLALFVSLAVLAKSAAALLLARGHLGGVPEEWNIVAIPYAGDATSVNFSDVFGDQRPFAPGVEVYMGGFDPAPALALYVTNKLMVYFLIGNARTSSPYESAIIRAFADTDSWRFSGDNLMQLMGHHWQRASPNVSSI